MSNIEQLYAIELYVHLQKSSTETFNLVQKAYPTDHLSKTQAFEWQTRFREERTTVENDEGCGRPNTPITVKYINAIKNSLNNNPRLTVKMFAGSIDILIGSCYSILYEQLLMSRVCSRWVPRLLTKNMKADRVFKSQEYFDNHFHEGNAYLKRIVTGDEVRLHYYDPETKQQPRVWKKASDPTPVKPRASNVQENFLLSFSLMQRGLCIGMFFDDLLLLLQLT